MACPKLLGQILVDVMCYVLAMLPSILLNRIRKPFQRGFFCNDASISLPYKTDIVSGGALMGGTLFIPMAVIAGVETIRYILKRASTKSTTSYKVSTRCSIPTVFVSFYKVFGVFLFGAAVTISLTDVGKYTVGRLRPHFLSVCQPNQMALVNCTTTSSVVYIEENICTRKMDWKLANARLSFPSGHSSIAIYTATFLILYLHRRVTWRFSRLAKPCLQVILALTAIFVALSRISDYMHHWSDVLAGSILGCFVGVLVELYVSRRHKETKTSSSSIIAPEMKLPYLVVNPGDGPSSGGTQF